MGNIGWLLLFFCIALTGLIFASNVYTRFWMNRLVTRKLEWLDFIQDTAMAPPDWRIRHERAMAKLPPGDGLRMRKLKDRARRDYLKRMDKIIRFAKVCTLVPNDAERAVIIRDLESIRSEWTEKDEALFTSV